MNELEIEAVLTGGEFSTEEQEAIRLMRRQLRDHGVTREPQLTRMACEFAEVLLMGTTPPPESPAAPDEGDGV